MTPELLAVVSTLSIDEKRELIEVLSEDVSQVENPDSEMPDWLFEELERRRLHQEAHPETAKPWSEVYARLKARYAR